VEYPDLVSRPIQRSVQDQVGEGNAPGGALLRRNGGRTGSDVARRHREPTGKVGIELPDESPTIRIGEEIDGRGMLVKITRVKIRARRRYEIATGIRRVDAGK